MSLPSRRARIAMLTGVATLGIAGTASASTAVYTTDTNQLQITVDGAPGTDLITCDVNGKIKFNGADPTRVPADANVETGCAAPVSLKVDEPDLTTATANILDLRGVTRKEFTGLAASATPLAINMGGGNDTVFGTEFADVITPGNNDDVVDGNAGDDTLVWNPGQASDVMNGGDGRDLVVDNGGGVDEQFVIKPKDGNPTRVDASRINNPFTLDIDAERLQVNGNGGNDSITGNIGVGGLIKTEMNGGDGNDVLVGTDGDDVQRGGAGNDDVSGARGNDDMGGDDGDDILRWNPGEGTDKFEGGAGNDIAQDNGGAAAEHFIVSANGARVTATRDNGAPFFLDIGTSETLDLNTAAGDDTVDVNNGLGALIKVDANLGEGNDAINARNDSAQVIDGDAGTDTAKVDATDQVSNVEKVKAPGKAKAKAKLLTKLLKLDDGKVKVQLSLPKGAATAKGNIVITRGKARYGSKKITLKPGKKSTFSVAFTKNARVKVAKAPGKKLKVKLQIKLNGGATTTQQLNVQG
jgi:RTX calcium-binding nonapeptide repeat (4 copies)